MFKNLVCLVLRCQKRGRKVKAEELLVLRELQKRHKKSQINLEEQILQKEKLK